MTINLINLIARAEEIRGRKMNANMHKFNHAVENQENPNAETLQFFSEAFSGYLKWSDENPEASNEAKKEALATNMQLDLRGKGKPQNTPFSVTDYIEFWKQPGNQILLQFEELARRRAEDRNGRKLNKTEIAQAVAEGWKPYVTMQPETLERNCRRIKTQLDVEFNSRKNYYINIWLCGTGGVRTQYFFETCTEDMKLLIRLHSHQTDN